MKKLLILSGKGGTGKTTAAAAFARFADARAIADCDVDAPNLHLVLGQSGAPEKSAFLGGMKAAVNPGLCTGCGICAFRCRFKAPARHRGEMRRERVRLRRLRGLRRRLSARRHHPGRRRGGKQRAVPRRRRRVFNRHAENGARKLRQAGCGGKNRAERQRTRHRPRHHRRLTGIGCPVIASMSGVDLALIVAEPSRSGLNDLERLVETARQFRTRLAVCVNKWEVSPTTTRDRTLFAPRRDCPSSARYPTTKTHPPPSTPGKASPRSTAPHVTP